MPRRLQVFLEESDYRRVARMARARGITVSEWARQVLREATRAEPTIDSGRKLAAIRTAAACSFPIGDIDEMLAEIERGRAMGLDGG
jgi:DNA helicase IV